MIFATLGAYPASQERCRTGPAAGSLARLDHGR